MSDMYFGFHMHLKSLSVSVSGSGSGLVCVCTILVFRNPVQHSVAVGGSVILKNEA